MSPLLLLAGLAAVVAAGRRGAAGKSGDGGEVGRPPALDQPAVWSLGADWAPACGGRLPVIPAASRDWGTVVRPGITAPLVWAWTGPGQRATVEAYPGRVIADVETYVEATEHYWRGRPEERAPAQWLAERCPAVTSHGYVAPRIKEVLKAFAALDRVGIPQVYDTDRSTLTSPGGPRRFLRNCIDSYARAGFRYVLPLLGYSAGGDIVEQWVEECDTMGVPYHFYSLQRLQAKPSLCEVGP